jgi:predicted ferric reductase
MWFIIPSMKLNKKQLFYFGIACICSLSFLPFKNYDGNLVNTTASVSGMLGISLLYFSVLLGVRYIVKLFTPDLKSVLDLHKKLGKYGVVFVLLHPFMEMYNYLEGFSWIYTPTMITESELHISLGRFALLLYLIIWISSAILREKLRYRPWLYLHYLTYPMLFLALSHIDEIGSFTKESLILSSFFMLARVGLLIIILTRLLFWIGVFKSKYIVQKVTNYDDSTFTVLLKPHKKEITPLPGQYIYIQTSRFGLAHPYSVLHYNKTTHEMTFGIKSVGLHSQKMQNMKTGDVLFLDGGYGVFTQEKTTELPRFYYAGGIGITPFVDQILNSDSSKTTLLYSVFNKKQLVYYDELKAKLQGNLHTFITQDLEAHDIEKAKINKEKISSLLEKQKGETLHYICGSPGFMKAITDMLLGLGIQRKNIYIEEFSN